MNWTFPEQNLPARGTAWLAQLLPRLQPGLPAPPALPDDLEHAWGTVAALMGLDDWRLAQRIATHFGLGLARLPRRLSDDAVNWGRLPEALAFGAVMLERHEDGHLVVAVADPGQPDLVPRLNFVSGMPVQLVVAPPSDLRRLREQHDGGLAAEGEGEAPGPAPGELRIDDDHPDEPLAVHVCNLMLRQAVELHASDVHVQPVGTSGLVRLRVDGMLRKVSRLPLPVMRQLISRVKAVSGMNPTDHLRPQDGRARLRWRDQALDLRLSTLPVTGGEKLVIRLLGGETARRLDDLDLPEPERTQVLNLINASMGVVLVSGPTGSGKTTTLYSVLGEKNVAEVNIVTVENSVEIRMPRLAQTEVNPLAGLDFASALRSVLRQDPDIILIGEVRDAETAGIAMQAAITGHLVLASVHANDAVSVLPRLRDLGVDADLAGEAVRGVVSQRLVRTLCPACAATAEAPWTEGEAWLRAHAGLQGSRRPVGCGACGGSGYKGRRSIMQVLTNTPELSALLDHGAPLSEVRAMAQRQGMRTLSDAALDRLAQGQTSLDEVLRVMGTDFWHEVGDRIGQAPPPSLIRGAAPAVDDAGVGAILVVAADPERRQRWADWLSLRYPRVVTAMGEAAVLQVLAREPDLALIVTDLDGLIPANVREMLELRVTLAGAAVPLLVFESGATELEGFIARLENATLAQRPDDAEALYAQVRQALGY